MIDIAGSGGSGYLVSIPVDGGSHSGPPQRYIVKAHADNLLALLRLLGLSRELLFAFTLLAMSALLWWPFIWRITRTVEILSAATQKMSQGRLDTRVTENAPATNSAILRPPSMRWPRASKPF